ncbi:nucleotidyltransferase domain-containing protein, partial [Ligaoa zhengdingensis]
MINYDLWIKEIMGKIMNCFGSRVHFVGIQGSYRRGEATEQSDIDLVFILDSLGMEDLAEYRAIVQSMPHAEKACGFVSGRAEL